MYKPRLTSPAVNPAGPDQKKLSPIAAVREQLTATRIRPDNTRLDQLDRTYSPQVSKPGSHFFSLPIELHNPIYGYLIPERIHIAPCEEDKCGFEPWALVSISRQFRCEIRRIAYPPTPIDLHLPNHESVRAYKTWIQGLPEGLEALIRHLSINHYVDINWKADGPVSERAFEREDRQNREWERSERKELGMSEEMLELYEPKPSLADFFDIEGEWVIRWLKYNFMGDCNDMPPLQHTLAEVETHRAASNNTVAGLGKDGVQRLVASYLTNRWKYCPIIEESKYKDSEGDE
ncbi:MAG: hypothetical protein Q9226_007791 [Calogaya cf. arnoldii]